jgi:hypothetical protein
MRLDFRQQDDQRALAAFSNAANGGMIVTASAAAVFNRELIIALCGPLQNPYGLFRARSLCRRQRIDPIRP